MSIKWMDRIWSDSPYDGARLLLHLAMADHANDEGWFYAGQNSLARKARCSVEYVRQCVLRMVEDGTLAIERKGNSKGRATEYRLLPFVLNEDGEIVRPEPPKNVGDALPNSDRSLPNSDRSLPNSTPKQPSLQPSNTTKTLVPATAVANSGTIITAWIDGLRVRPPDRVVGQTAREVRLLVDQGFPADKILEALRSVSAKGLHPSTLASELNMILNPPTTMRGGASTADQRLSGLTHLLVGSDRGHA